MNILASGNLNSGNVETGVPEHGNRLDWLNGYLSGTTHLSSPEPLCGAKHTFLGSLMSDSMDMVAGIFIMSVLLEGALDEELNEELGYSKYDYRNQETDNSRNGHSKKTLQRVPKESASMCMSRRMKNTQYLTWKCRQPLREICPNGCDIIRE